MRYLALATDYDGVIATEGHASDSAIAAIKRLRKSGRRAILITGRRLENLQESFSELTLFDYIVAENGAVVYEPRTKEETILADPPPAAFIERLQQLGVQPIDVGRVIVATWLPHHTAVLQAIQELGLELHIIFNRAAVMVLPAGINKLSGMNFALRKLGLSRHEVMGVGDSENDHSFLQKCECAATVANAVPEIRKLATITAKSPNGNGLAELIDELIATDLQSVHDNRPRLAIPLGRRDDGTTVGVPVYGPTILIAGPSGSGKSTVTAGIVERLMKQSYQMCIIDPEGDYGTLQNVITLGHHGHAVNSNEVLSLMEDPYVNLNVNLLGIPLMDRPEFLATLLPHLQSMRTRTGRPHWIVLDEAHHMLPKEWARLDRTLPQTLGETILVTVHPDHLAPKILPLVDTMIAVGPNPEDTIRRFAEATGQSLEWPPGLNYEKGRAVIWFPHEPGPPLSVQILPGRAERIRHHRKYAEGNMHHRSFFFRGPRNRHNLKAQNLAIFSQIAEGIGEDTWMHHLRRGDYSRWLRGAVKDPYLADQVERIEQRQDLSAAETKQLILSLIEARYTLPE
jgi:HAD superfamily hydrolase (TIGR01484 family)